MDFSLVPLVADVLSNGATFLSQVAVDSGDDWPEALIASSAVIAGCALISVIVWQIFLTARRSIDAKASEETRDELRSLTQRSIAAGESNANELARVSQGVTDLRVRLEHIEKILRDVE